jgi:hypothetical protein
LADFRNVGKGAIGLAGALWNINFLTAPAIAKFVYTSGITRAYI